MAKSPQSARRRRPQAAASAPKPQSEELMPVKRPEFIERVVARSGLRKAVAKPVIEATLHELATAIAKGELLNLPPLGRVKVTQSKELPNGQVHVCRVRQKADTAEHSDGAPSKDNTALHSSKRGAK